MSELTGKYAKLRDDLIAALAAGKAAETGEDGGTCNNDSPAIELPRWNVTLVQQAAREAGSAAFEWKLYRNKLFVFRPHTAAQGNDRSRNAETATAYLKSIGYHAMDYCQMD